MSWTVLLLLSLLLRGACNPAKLTSELVLQLAEDKKQKIYDKSLGAIKHWLERFDTIIIGPGLGRDEMVHHVVIEVSPQSVKFSFSAGRYVLFVLACLLQPYVAALPFAVSPCCCLSIV